MVVQMKVYGGLVSFFTGNILVQLIAILIMPVVTRIYSPSELGVYQFIMTVALILSPFINFSMNQAIVKEVDIFKRQELFSAAVKISIFSSILFIILFSLSLIFIDSSFDLSFGHFIATFLVMFLTSIFSLTQALNLSEGKYKKYSKSIVIQSLLSNLSKIFLGLFSSSSLSLILSICIGTILSIKYGTESGFRRFWTNVRFDKVIDLLRLHQEFTLFLSVSTFIGIFINWHIVLVAPLFGNSYEVGLLALALMITRTPMYPFLTSISNFCYSELVQRKKKSKRYYNLLLTLSFIGAFVSVLATIILYFWGEELIGFVFGNEWKDAGLYALWLSFSMIPALTLYPIYFALANIKGNQKYLLNIDMVMLFFSAIIIGFCVINELSLSTFVILCSILLFIQHILKFGLIIGIEIKEARSIIC